MRNQNNLRNKKQNVLFMYFSLEEKLLKLMIKLANHTSRFSYDTEVEGDIRI